MGPSYAGILGPIAFTTVLARGLLTGSSADALLIPAFVSLIAFAAIGYVAGSLADRVVLESVKQKFDLELSNQRAEENKKSTA